MSLLNSRLHPERMAPYLRRDRQNDSQNLQVEQASRMRHKLCLTRHKVCDTACDSVGLACESQARPSHVSAGVQENRRRILTFVRILLLLFLGWSHDFHQLTFQPVWVTSSIDEHNIALMPYLTLTCTNLLILETWFRA